VICNELRKITGRPYIYTILLVKTPLEEDLLSSINTGTDDCIHRPLNSYELRYRVRAEKRFNEIPHSLLLGISDYLDLFTSQQAAGNCTHRYQG
jgi:DNA-binding response OmpR family regulator